jgi:DNA-binding beta-propeller fold protein YncE
MRWIDGGDLAAEIARTGGLDPRRVQRLLTQVAGALDAVHLHGLVHGDLKPANVLLEQRAGAEHAYLSDFGAGRRVETTASGQWLGTVEYVAPETIRGAPPDPRADLYGLACVAFEALTGAPPFHRDTAWATLWAHANDPPPSARQRRPALAPAVDAVLARGLAKEPGARYPSAQRLLEALGDALLAGRGADTRPIGPSVTESGSPSPVPAATVALEDEQRRGRGTLRMLRAHRRRWAAFGLLLLAGCVAAGVAIASAGSSPRHRAAPSSPVTISRSPLGGGTVPAAVTSDNTAAYVLDSFCQCVDIMLGSSPPDRIHLPAAPRSAAYDSKRHRLWVGLENSHLVALDLISDRVLDPKGVALPITPDQLAMLGDEVIAEQGNPAALVRIDARRTQVVGKPVYPGAAAAGAAAAGLVAYNGSILTMLAFPVRLEQFDANLQRVAQHALPIAFPRGMALDSSGYLWMPDYDAARVWRIDPATGKPAGAPLAVGHDPVAVAVADHYVWVVNAGDRTVSLINLQAAQVRAVSIPVDGTGPIAATLTDFAGEAYMASGTELFSFTPKS